MKKGIRELTVTGSGCWGGGLGVSRGGEHGDDDSHHHKDNRRGSGDRRHFLGVARSPPRGNVGGRDTDQNDGLLPVGAPSLSLDLRGIRTRRRERARWRLAFGSGDAGGRAPEGFIHSLVISWWKLKTKRNASMQGSSTRAGRTASLVPRTGTRTLGFRAVKVRWTCEPFPFGLGPCLVPKSEKFSVL